MSVLYVVSLLAGTFGAWLMARSAGKLGLLDQSNARSSHHATTPKGGGIGIAGAFLLAAIMTGLPVFFWLPLGTIAVLGLLGDRIDISPKIRLPIHLSLAGVLVVAAEQTTAQSWLSVGLIAFWIVFIAGTANFYNFMDGINGIAGITGVVGFGLLAWFAFLSGSPIPLLILAICMGLACLGFLPFNMPNARVFMGDVGSVLLGFVFAGMVVVLSKSFLDFFCLASFLFPFYADELSTMVIRIRDRENLLRAHRRHLYQLLANEKGISHWKVSVGYGLLQMAVGVSVLLVRSFGISIVLLILVCYSVPFFYASFSYRKRLETDLKEA